MRKRHHNQFTLYRKNGWLWLACIKYCSTWSICPPVHTFSVSHVLDYACCVLSRSPSVFNIATPLKTMPRPITEVERIACHTQVGTAKLRAMLTIWRRGLAILINPRYLGWAVAARFDPRHGEIRVLNTSDCSEICNYVGVKLTRGRSTAKFCLLLTFQSAGRTPQVCLFYAPHNPRENFAINNLRC